MERYIPVHGLEEAICKDVTVSKIELNFTTVLTVFLLFTFLFFKNLTGLVLYFTWTCKRLKVVKTQRIMSRQENLIY